MENASKALIMAGAVLVAILIISLGILIFKNWSGFAKDSTDMNEQQISNFNSKITPYLGNHISGSQVNALLQYCLSNNMSASQSGGPTVSIIKGEDSILDTNSKKYTRVDTKGNDYTVEVTDYTNGFISKIKINQNP